jgi:hypothetical protein
LTSLGQQCVFNDTGITIQQSGSLSTEVLKDFKAFAADVL